MITYIDIVLLFFYLFVEIILDRRRKEDSEQCSHWLCALVKKLCSNPITTSTIVSLSYYIDPFRLTRKLLVCDSEVEIMLYNV